MNQLITPQGFPYAYETHMHTSQGSRCGAKTGAEMAEAYKEAGYTGIIITDHFIYGNTKPDRNLPWKEWVNAFCRGYEDAKLRGDQIGLDVYFGWEAGYDGTEFLIYGLNKEWLLNHEEIKDATVKEQFEIVHRYGGIVIHAHPFREEDYIPKVRLFPEYVDGVETINAAHCHHLYPQELVYNERAKAYAVEHDFPATAGSDMHDTKLFYGGMAFSRKLENIQDFMKAVMNREGKLLPLD